MHAVSSRRKPKVYRPTPGVLRVLRHIKEGRSIYTGVYGRSEHGAMRGIIAAIHRHGLVVWGEDDEADVLTEAGRAALGEPDRGTA